MKYERRKKVRKTNLFFTLSLCHCVEKDFINFSDTPNKKLNFSIYCRVALAWLMAKKPFIVPIPGTRMITHMKENRGAANVKLTNDDMNELENGFASIGVFGDRAPEGLKASYDLGTSLGTSSIGTNGKTPLPKNK